MRGATVQHQLLERIDPTTGRRVKQLTSLPGNHHHLYFTSSSFTADRKHVLFISDSSGSPNVYKLSVQDGSCVQLTDNRKGIMQSYVYYDGTPYTGLGKASPSYNPATNKLLYIQDHTIRLIDVDSLEEQCYPVLPDKVMTGFTHLSQDGRYACVPYISAAAFAVGPGNPFALIREKVQSESLHSHVLVIDTLTGQSEVLFSQVGWITHVQFHPRDCRKVLYNHEGGMVEQRMWLYDHGRIRKLRDQSQGSGLVWICHEMWTQDGNGVIYHGTTGVPNDPAMNELPKQQEDIVSFAGYCDLAQDTISEILFPQEMKAYGHFTARSDDRWLVTDGVIDAKSLHLLQPDWQGKQTNWTKLCEHGSSFSVQDVHPHPIFSPDDRSVLFTSDVHNSRQSGHLYMVEL